MVGSLSTSTKTMFKSLLLIFEPTAVLGVDVGRSGVARREAVIKVLADDGDVAGGVVVNRGVNGVMTERSVRLSS